METFSALLAICAGNSPVSGEFPSQRPVTRSFDVFFYLLLNKRLSKQPRGWCFETPSWSLWRHCNGVKLTLSCCATGIFGNNPGTLMDFCTRNGTAIKKSLNNLVDTAFPFSNERAFYCSMCIYPPINQFGNRFTVWWSWICVSWSGITSTLDALQPYWSRWAHAGFHIVPCLSIGR